MVIYHRAGIAARGSEGVKIPVIIEIMNLELIFSLLCFEHQYLSHCLHY